MLFLRSRADPEAAFIKKIYNNRPQDLSYSEGMTTTDKDEPSSFIQKHIPLNPQNLVICIYLSNKSINQSINIYNNHRLTKVLHNYRNRFKVYYTRQQQKGEP